MLNKDFFKIIEFIDNDDNINQFAARIELNAGHDIFKGHFPGEPIVPGVCLLQMAKEIIEERLKVKLQLIKAPNVKYLSIVNPDVDPIIEYQFQVSRVEQQVTAEVLAKNHEAVCIKMKVVYVEVTS